MPCPPAQCLSFKQLLDLLSQEHERELRELENANAKLQESFCDQTEEGTAKSIVEAQTSREQEMNIVGEKVGSSATTDTTASPTREAKGRPAAYEGTNTGGSAVAVDIAKALPQPNKRSAKRHQSDGVFVLQLWTEWTKEEHVRKRLPSIFLPSAASTETLTGPLVFSRQLSKQSYLQRSCPSKPSDLVINPSSMKRVAWDMLAIVLLVYDFIWIPLQLIFRAPSYAFTEIGDKVTMYYWTFDVVMSCITGYYSAEGQLVTSVGKIVKRYLQSNFLMDLVIVGNDWLLIVFDSLPDGLGIFRIGKFARVLRMGRSLRLMRLRKLQEIFFLIQERISAEWILVIFGIVQNVVMLLAVNHVIASLWFLLGSVSDDSDRWVFYYRLWDSDILEKYLISLHWALSSFTPAQKPDVKPRNSAERAFAVAMILIAMIGFSTFLGSITTQMTRLRQLKSSDLQQTFVLRRFLHENRISRDLSARVTRFVKIAKRIHMTRISQDKVELLKYLSGPLSVELQSEVFCPSLKVHPFFEIYGAKSKSAMNRLCYSAVAKEYFSRQDLIFSYGSDSMTMMFLISGTLYYLRPKGVRWDTYLTKSKPNRKRVMTVTPGNWFCEAALWISGWVHRGTLGTLVDSEIVTLCSTKFRQITLEHLDVFESCRAFATQEFLPKVMSTRDKYGCYWDLPQEVIDAEIRPKPISSSSDRRVLIKQQLDKNLRTAEQLQADMNYMPSDSEEEGSEKEESEADDTNQTEWFAHSSSGVGHNITSLQAIGEKYRRIEASLHSSASFANSPIGRWKRLYLRLLHSHEQS